MSSDLDEIKKQFSALQEEMVAVNQKLDKIRGRMMRASLWGLLRLLIILVPIVLSFWLLQPQLRTFYASYAKVMGLVQQLPESSQSGSPPSIQLDPETIQKLREQYPQYFQQ